MTNPSSTRKTGSLTRLWVGPRTRPIASSAIGKPIVVDQLTVEDLRGDPRRRRSSAPSLSLTCRGVEGAARTGTGEPPTRVAVTRSTPEGCSPPVDTLPPRRRPTACRRSTAPAAVQVMTPAVSARDSHDVRRSSSSKRMAGGATPWPSGRTWSTTLASRSVCECAALRRNPPAAAHRRGPSGDHHGLGTSRSSRLRRGTDGP